VPKYVRFVAEYPQTPSGKVKKFELRALMIAALGLEADSPRTPPGVSKHAGFSG